LRPRKRIPPLFSQQRFGPESVCQRILSGHGVYYAHQSNPADGVFKSIRDFGRRAYAWEADLSESRLTSDLFDEAEKALGRVKLLVNNAAYWEGNRFLPDSAELANKLNESWMDRLQTIRNQYYLWK
jgi:NAD(P)-dependent dehydrogenase (short-subunit alcohol dehydrogenase family)